MATPLWFAMVTRAAERGDEVAQYSLGLMYAQGLGIPQNDNEAIKNPGEVKYSIQLTVMKWD
jgi:TPR repeat protein